jgi:tetratricopeptide (TPR) repeat protein
MTSLSLLIDCYRTFQRTIFFLLTLTAYCISPAIGAGPVVCPVTDYGAFERQLEHISRAEKLQHSKDFKGAVEQWLIVLKNEPNDISPLEQLAHCYAELHEPRKAIDCCNRLLQLNPAGGGTLLQSILSYNELKETDKAIAANNLMKKYGFTGESFGFLCSIPSRESTIQTVGMIDSEISRFPACPDLYLSKAELLQRLGKFRAAIVASEQCAHSAVYHSWIWRLAKERESDAFCAVGNYDKAFLCVNQALEGLSFRGAKMPDTAAHVLKAMLITKANVLSQQKKFKEAVSALNLLSAYHYADPDIYLERASLHMKEKNVSGALEDLDIANRVAPHQPKPIEKKAETLSLLNRHLEAAQEYSRVLAMDPSEPMHYVRRAREYESMNSEHYLRMAIADYTQAIGLDPNEVVSYQSRAKLYRKIKDTKNANLDDAQVKRIDDSHLYRK